MVNSLKKNYRWIGVKKEQKQRNMKVNPPEKGMRDLSTNVFSKL